MKIGLQVFLKANGKRERGKKKMLQPSCSPLLSSEKKEKFPLLLTAVPFTQIGVKKQRM